VIAFRRSARLLRDVDVARAPRPEFERALRTELFGAGIATRSTSTSSTAALDDVDAVVVTADDELAERRARVSSRRTTWLASAALIAVAVGIVAVVGVQVRDDQVDVSDAPPASVVAEAQAACARFNETAFGDLGRDRVVGNQNDEQFVDREAAQRLTRQMQSALATFAAELQSAGVEAPEVFARLDVAASNAAGALAQAQTGSLDQAAEDMRLIETELVDVERALGSEGIVGCL
jgi:hypothetical protein